MSSGTPKPADLFEDLWRRLGESHHDALQELETKVSKLKKERCLDAERLEVFFNRSQQLKEQNKSLQDAIGLLEKRLRAGQCDRCGILEENLKSHQEQNLRLIAKLSNERNCLKDENRKLHSELQKLKMSRSELRQTSSPEPEEGIIPDSPILPSSPPVANKLKKRRNVGKHVRYAELPLPQCNNSLFSELKNEPGGAEVLVPNTCELETSHISRDVNLNLQDAVAETCGLDLLLAQPHVKMATAAGHQSSSKSSWKFDVCFKSKRPSPSSTLIHSPDSTTERSPSLLPRVRRFSEDVSINKAKRKKEESELEVKEENKQGNQEVVDKQKEGRHIQPELIKRTSSSLSSQDIKKEPLDIKLNSSQKEASTQKPNVSCLSSAFKKPNVGGRANKDGGGKRGNPLEELNASHDQHEEEEAERRPKEEPKVEPAWSVDPALALSMYNSEWTGDERQEDQANRGDLEDTDSTWVSHSLLQRREDGRDNVCGLGEKANDSLDMMFDTTAYGDYKSYNSSHLGQSQQCDDDSDEEEEEEDEQAPHENTLSQRKERKAGQPTFAHVAVVRKKDERRKLKGTTCKECETYYAHLPEEEKQKKLSACSRHRFLYVPPCTPENFWEVGFPSTQTCIERGYIKEEKNPQARPRRRQPLNALFTPKKRQPED
uniref:DNA endonuclease RBBP8 n=1 Tax=Scatophagus argus TaxID=75038 RepID=UPI001ED856E0|nr:DNA endonuclease RBBP8 [Scatophagus argus]XP_046226690.1 DNA endonuclease RBBP8 [Scatophagus argus]